MKHNNINLLLYFNKYFFANIKIFIFFANIKIFIIYLIKNFIYNKYYYILLLEI